MDGAIHKMQAKMDLIAGDVAAAEQSYQAAHGETG
jgi:hypothetical protein